MPFSDKAFTGVGKWQHLRLSFPVAVGLLLAIATAQAGEPSVPLLPNGGFELPDPAVPGKPAGWDVPDDLGVRWVEAETNAAAHAHGMAMRLNTAVSEKAMVAQWRAKGIAKWDIPNADNGPVAGTYGLSFYSDAIPVVSGQPYRVSFDFKGASGGAKVWVRAYGMFRGEKRRRYETIVNCRVNGSGWQSFTQTFYPTKLRPRVSEMKVMLYAYWPPGVYWFDNVRIDPISIEEYERE